MITIKITMSGLGGSCPPNRNLNPNHNLRFRK
jgi:hypothetical protein